MGRARGGGVLKPHFMNAWCPDAAGGGAGHRELYRFIESIKTLQASTRERLRVCLSSPAGSWEGRKESHEPGFSAARCPNTPTSAVQLFGRKDTERRAFSESRWYSRVWIVK